MKNEERPWQIQKQRLSKGTEDLLEEIIEENDNQNSLNGMSPGQQRGKE